MIFPVIYAVLVWTIAMQWRRRWPAFVGVVVGVGLLLATYAMVRRWDGHIAPVYRHILLLFWPYTLVLGGMGMYIACLPRRPGPMQCGKCRYDLAGLNPRGLQCPECGTEFQGKGSGREPPEPELIPIPKGPAKSRTVL